ncbi:hypothetical protein [Actinomyces vulturis]|uniref:hypothetical protein n=1 Tax=Actinomyces vulturis TaxID=1857645 RepID=UPI000835AEC8|nr:hypothetical protein [Actinomyces vulturis]
MATRSDHDYLEASDRPTSANSSPLVGPAQEYAKASDSHAASGGFFPHPHTWSMNFSHSAQGTFSSTHDAPAIFVNGGSTAVNTDDIDALITELNTVSDYLSDAIASAESTRGKVTAALPPPYELFSEPFLVSGYSALAVTDLGVGADTEIPATWRDTQTQCLIDPFALEEQFIQAQHGALDALDTYIDGPEGLHSLRDTIESLISDLRVCVDIYTQADVQASPTLPPLNGPWALADQQRVGPLIPILTQIVGLGEALLLSPFLAIGGVGAFFGGDPANLPLVSDGGQFLLTAMEDPILSQWLTGDSLALFLTLPWVMRARSGQSSYAVQQYFTHLAHRMDPQVSSALGETVRQGSKEVPTATLSPMQRLAYYVAGVAQRSGEQFYGPTTGIVVSPRGSNTTSVLPPASRDPFALATSLSTTPEAFRPLPTPPRTIAQTIAHSDELQHSRPTMDEGSKHQSHDGSISIIKTTHSDGTRTWMVIVPGTRDWSMGGEDLQDLLTNLQGVAGQPTDMESSVVAAMTMAGIQPGEPVGFYGHSQGAITVSNIAADTAVRERFTMTSVLTAGGPTAGAALPSETYALHIENADDAVPALDAQATPTSPSRIVVTIDSHTTNRGYPHMSSVYATVTEGIEQAGEPAIDDWSQRFQYLTGAGDEGAVSEEMIIDCRREIGG